MSFVHFFKPKAILPLCLALFALFPVACGAQEAKPKPSKKDWGSIALRVVSIMEADHFAKVKFDDDMSARTLERYLDMLDGRKVYFTAEDVAEFESKYLEKIDDQVKKGDIPAADAIYSVFKERVKNRVAFAQKLVDDNNFTYDTDNHIAISRDEMPYAKQGAEYDQLWRNRIEGDMLREVLVDELADKKKAEEGEEAADDDEDERKPIAERVMKRYQEFEKLIFENDQDDIAAFFIKAITRSWDPHSEYYSQQDYENFRINMSKKLSGIGAMLKEHEDGTAIIDGLVVGGPAFKEGSLKPKDKIVGVGQGDEEIVDTIGKRLSDTVELIRGKVGTVVTLKVRPASASDPSETTLIKIVREEVDLKDNRATADLIVTKDPQGNEQKIGWLELPSFYSDMNGGDTSTTTDVRRVLSALKVRGIDGLVIDLRDNGGGALEEAINMTGLFIRKGPVVMSIDSKGGRDERNSRAARPAWDGPLVVLTNRASASASEIFAAALQDYGRAIVVGEVSTFGKGTVQQMRPVYTRPLNFFNRDANGQEGALKLTIQTFYRINGESTQLTGVVPDLRLPSIFDADEFGEGSLKHPMSVDPVKAAKYDAFFEGKLPIEALRQASELRIANSKDFGYVLQDVAEDKERLDKNEISINKEKRQADASRIDAENKERKAERIDRYASIREAEKDLFTIYTITQDNFTDQELTLKADISEEELRGMTKGNAEEKKTAKELKEEEEAKKLEYPHTLNPYERETVSIVQDLIAIEKTGKPVAISKVAPAKRAGITPVQ